MSDKKPALPDEPTRAGEREHIKRGRSVWGQLFRALGPRFTRAQLLAAVLSAAVGFALVVQMTQNQSDDLASLRQADLVRLLDEVTQRSNTLGEEQSKLQEQLAGLQSGSDQSRAALEAARIAAESQGIVSGRLPAVGPGLRIEVSGNTAGITASDLLNVLQELRNAGAEAIQVNDVRITTSSSFSDVDRAIALDGKTLETPYEWLAIGEPNTMLPALEIPGGALAVLRNAGANANAAAVTKVKVTATATPRTPQYLTPVH